MEDKNKISDELLAAYLDGNTNEEETKQILQALNNDSALREVLDIAINVDEGEEANDILPMMFMAAESKENLCGVFCEMYVLNRRGIHYVKDNLLELARQKHWLRMEGTPLHCLGNLLGNHGLMVTRKYDATINDIKEALRRDNDIIVAVDSDKLYPEREDKENAPNHAIVVIAVDGESVKIYDPQESSIFNFQFSIFQRAWQESKCYMIRILQSADEYEPNPVNLDSIDLTDDLLELQEAIAENAHEVWAATRMAEGWTYGPVRDDEKKKHPDLIPYSALPDSEKEYDRRMALDTIKLVKKLGFDIVKHI